MVRWHATHFWVPLPLGQWSYPGINVTYKAENLLNHISTKILFFKVFYDWNCCTRTLQRQSGVRSTPRYWSRTRTVARKFAIGRLCVFAEGLTF